MAVPKGPWPVKTSTRRKRVTGTSYDVVDVPPEIWAIIGSLASRQSLSRLCSVSLRFCFTFSPRLYANTVDPPLTAAQSVFLIRTLSDEKAYSRKPHPVSMIRSLGLIDGDENHKFNDKAKVKRALRHLVLPSPHSALSVVHWSLEAGIDELGSLLGLPGNFPRLRELVVSSKGNNNNFGFLHIRGLQVLGLEIDFHSLLDTQLETNYYTN
ncbi:hypothetical protein C8R46DRAFT_1055852 [Mycena filopes]|nr:hypothetical protein C8R46DRAFT_1055852 [Mycena filopes]